MTKTYLSKWTFLLLFCLASFISVKAQEIGVDRKNKSVFTYYSKDDSRLSFSADGNLSYSQIINPRNIVYTRITSPDTTIIKFAAWAMKIKLTSDEDLLSSDEISKLRPGLQFQFGRQVSIDTFKALDRNLPTSKKSVKTYGWNVILGVGNTKLYDSSLKTTGKIYPGTFGVEGNFNFIFKNNDTNNTIRKVLAFTGSLTRTSKGDDLKSYQEIEDVTVLPDIVTLEELEGKYGVMKRITSFRLAASFPMYIGHFNPIPFVSFNAKSFSEPVYYVGVFTNILKDKLNVRSFQIPSSLGFGVDWKYTKNTFSKAIFFIKGEIKF